MGKKSAAGLLGTILVTGVAVGIIKYLKDYQGVRFTDETQIKSVKNDSKEVKEAAKRTYIAIREKGDVKEAAAGLSKAAGAVVTDAAGIAMTAGTETANAFKDIKSRYDDDPEAVKAEIADNLTDMTQDIARKAQAAAVNIKDRIVNAGEEPDIDEAFADMTEEVQAPAVEAAQVQESADAEKADTPSDEKEVSEEKAAAEEKVPAQEASEKPADSSSVVIEEDKNN